MNELFWLTAGQMERLRPFFPKSRGKPRVDDRRVLSGIIFIHRDGLMWKHTPREYGPPKTLYNRWKRWSRMGVFATIMTELAAQAQETGIVMIDATHAKAHRSAQTTNVWPAPLQALIGDGSSSLHKRIRHVGGLAAAKMEIRASRSS